MFRFMPILSTVLVASGLTLQLVKGQIDPNVVTTIFTGSYPEEYPDGSCQYHDPDVADGVYREAGSDPLVKQSAITWSQVLPNTVDDYWISPRDTKNPDYAAAKQWLFDRCASRGGNFQ